MTYDNTFELTGLEPFRSYSVNLITSNLYSTRRDASDRRRGNTLSGVKTSEGGIYTCTAYYRLAGKFVAQHFSWFSNSYSIIGLIFVVTATPLPC